MARSAKQVAAQLKAAKASAAKRRGTRIKPIRASNVAYRKSDSTALGGKGSKNTGASRVRVNYDSTTKNRKVQNKHAADRSISSARKLDAMDALHAKLPENAYGVNSKGGFITRESYGEQAWTSLAQYTRAKTPKAKKIAQTDHDKWKSGWGMGAG